MGRKRPVSMGRRFVAFFTSLKTAIPLLVVTVAVTIVGSLFPDPDFFRSPWYLGLLGLNGLSLLLITIVHIPSILARKGRNALIGVVTTHLGILILIAGAIYGGFSGTRMEVRVIEGEMTVVPGLPFVIHLDRLMLEEYPEEAFAHMNTDLLPKKRQDSELSLYRGGDLWLQTVAAPGSPARAGEFTILPSIRDVGWYFELKVTDRSQRLSYVPVRPWAPPLVRVGPNEVMVHSLVEAGSLAAEVFTIRGDTFEPLGTIGAGRSLTLDGYVIELGDYRRYTGLKIYNRPHAPLLLAGSLAMLFGLVWHFYYRHRERGTTARGGNADA